VTEREKRVELLGSKIDPALKSWIDRVIVPGLVREFVSRARKAASFPGPGPSTSKAPQYMRRSAQ
jgi:hypothetical protein